MVTYGIVGRADWFGGALGESERFLPPRAGARKPCGGKSRPAALEMTGRGITVSCSGVKWLLQWALHLPRVAGQIFSRARPAVSDTAPNRRSFPGDTRAGGRGAAAPRCRAFECRFAVLRKGGCRTVREWSGCAHRLRLVPRATASAGWEPARLRRKWWRPEWKQPRQALAL